LAEHWRSRTDIAIHHIVGRRDWSEFGSPDIDGPIDYRTVEYEDDMPTLLVAADVAICRSGASTVTELAVAGLPSLLVPLPGAPRDHQRANSRELVDVGGAVVVDDDQLSGPKLADMLGPLVDDGERRRDMATAARSVGRPGAADAVAALVLSVADGDTSLVSEPSDLR
jgi:UDP-N-acetylglucosamine:LPS N-acetylglucosamine transferase